MSGLSQLTAIGSQSEWLSGSPQVSFWKSSFKRYTNFAQQVEEQNIEGLPANNGMSAVRLSKNGDMLSYIYLSALSGTTNVETNWGHVIDHIDVLVGGNIVDTIDYTFTSNVAPPNRG